MRLFAKLIRLVWGDEVDRALRPVLAVSFAGSTAFSAGWTFVGIWAIEELGATSSELGVGFLIGAVAASIAGYLGGHASDHLGRRPLILLGWGLQATFTLSYIFVGHHVVIGLALVALGAVFGAIGTGADQAMIADLVPPERHEAAYASVRVASNLGVAFGPPIGGLLLIGRHWPVLFAGVALMSAVGFAIAYRYLPRRGAYSPDEPPGRGSFGVIRRDQAFLLFLLSGGLAYLVYVAIETVLPISAVNTHGIAESTWGFVVIINPVLVTLFQLRVTRWVARYPAGPKLVTAMLLMGGSFLLLLLSGSVAMFALRDRRLRDRRDAVGADLAGDRRRACARGRPWRLYGCLRKHRLLRLRARAVHRAPAPRQLRRRRGLVLLRSRIGCRGRQRRCRRSGRGRPAGRRAAGGCRRVKKPACDLEVVVVAPGPALTLRPQFP